MRLTPRDRSLRLSATGAQATGASIAGPTGVSALAIGAAAVGAYAVGALAIGRLVVAQAVIKKLEAGEVHLSSLTVDELRVAGRSWTPPPEPAAA